MASSERPPSHPGQQRSGLSLYANLLNPNSGASDGQTISRAPVVFKQQSAEDVQKEDDTAKKNAALRFQPTKRPQQTAQKPKAKPTAPKVASSLNPSFDPSSKPANPPPPPPPVKTTLADWTADGDDVNDYYAGEKRQRGGRKKRRKNKEEAAVAQDWDDIYDPSRPNNYEDYKHSEERYREIREWKDKLYAHKMKRRGSSEMSDERSAMNSTLALALQEDHELTAGAETFAPPSAYSFAPPPKFEDDESPPPITTEEAPPPPPAENITNDATGEDAYARRMRLSGMAPPASSLPPPPPPPPPPAEEQRPQQPQPPPPPQPTASVSRAPVRYQLPAADTSLPATDEELEAALADADAQEDTEDVTLADAPRSSRPGQKGFAERLMSKYGWSKGSGLGAAGTGIVNPLRVQVEKRKKKSDAEGGGWVGPSAKGKIIGSKSGKDKDAKGGKGKEEDGAGLSEVVVLRGMVDGLDLDKEIGEGSLMQEIGGECGEKYGRVERVFIDRESMAASTPVFIKFTSQLSALRAVQALEGRVFNGNTIGAKFFDLDKFEAGIYE